MDAASMLYEADRDLEPIAAFASSALVSDPYAVQADFFSRRSQRVGSAPAGYKVALTSPQAQVALGSTEPASGRFLAVDVVPSGSTIDLAERFSPILEVELIFRVRQDLPLFASLDQVAQGCDVAAGLECPDSRYRNWFGGEFAALALNDLIADNCLAGFVVVGETWLPASSLDLPAVTASLVHDDQVIASGVATAVMGNPLLAVVWLSGQLARNGEILTAGTVVSAGTLTGPVVATRGTTRSEFSDGLGQALVRFV
ncbi:unannotated protein [freshwater metagenome]|uniref:Unannotated protein n=1 Tax=freshwater metagenome TaxID=449393 RepID=A0A6J7KSJ3_9ZZZZ|nr:hypothetical protein [Actinomycetota bacterium]